LAAGVWTDEGCLYDSEVLGVSSNMENYDPYGSKVDLTMWMIY
jgi:hypothetical protein